MFVASVLARFDPSRSRLHAFQIYISCIFQRSMETIQIGHFAQRIFNQFICEILRYFVCVCLRAGNLAFCASYERTDIYVVPIVLLKSICQSGEVN